MILNENFFFRKGIPDPIAVIGRELGERRERDGKCGAWSRGGKF